MAILVTGGLGYIGSNTVAEILKCTSEDVIVLDSLHNSSIQRLSQLKEDVGDEAFNRLSFIECDIRDLESVTSLTQNYRTFISAIIHFAGLKSVDKSFDAPLEYYSVNVEGTISLLKFAETLTNLQRIVFSSSATVYGNCAALPIVETSPLSATNPYGRTKLHCEQILEDYAAREAETGSSVDVVALRYFNPVGASKSGFLGDDLSSDPPASLFPSIANHKRRGSGEFVIFGDDYPTRDGTCIRDFVSVSDLASAHIAALRASLESPFEAINVGTGVGYSIREVLDTFKKFVHISYSVGPRRPGDVAEGYADTTKASSHLNWTSKDSLRDMVSSELKFWATR
jgi:UDP-glucose 4-epimerase